MAGKLLKKDLDQLKGWAKANPKRERTLFDSAVEGLYARARRGKVEFWFRYDVGNGRQKMRLGPYGSLTIDTARDAARDHYAQVAKGKDPRAQRRQRARDAKTVADAVRFYLEDLKERAESAALRGSRSGYDTMRRRLEKNVLSRVGQIPVRQVTVEQIRALHRSLKETPAEANRTITALSAVFGEAARRGLVPQDFNPCRQIKKYEESGERRALSRRELSALGESLREAEESQTLDPAAILAIRLFALTGMRRSELLGHESKARRGDREGLRWGDVDLKRGTVRLRRTKTGAQTRVLGKAAVDLLRRAKPEDAQPDDPVCPSPRLKGRPFVGVDRPRAKLYEDAGIEGADLHSLRHTFASIGAHVSNGRYAALVGALLGHAYTKAGSITERYIHGDLEALRPAADAIAGMIAALLVSDEGAAVVSFERVSH